MTGLSDQVVTGMFASDSGGAPKPSVSLLDIRANGCVGDYQRDKKHHGGPNRAVCIFSQDVIEDLNSEGHPIKAGDCGENIVVSGLDWNSLRPGVQLQIGDCILKIESDAPPCKTIRHAFTDGSFSAISYKKYPNRTRWYCSVVKEDIVSLGESVFLV